MSRTGSIATWSRAVILSIVLLAGLTLRAADAEPALCATVTYEKFSGPKHTVVDDCWVPSSWDPLIWTGPDDCTGPPQIVRVCEGITVSAPI